MELPPPVNGALACNNWANGLMCAMSCNDQFDIPITAPTTGQYVCDETTGLWSPHATIYNCTGKLSYIVSTVMSRRRECFSVKWSRTVTFIIEYQQPLQL